eukprot:TRINITY_DN1532_c0_g1_i2.p1 TRINITY_DN1532_c0_g1~~TRINITY_DN1532_c0_g1_i2.p1  ORF type:complete len:264 (-),score=84.44 TRINITY_DN1532_c0_g1_i2:48-839(-)
MSSKRNSKRKQVEDEEQEDELVIEDKKPVKKTTKKAKTAKKVMKKPSKETREEAKVVVTSKVGDDGKPRCFWVGFNGDDLMRKYHDEEWGEQVHDDNRLFEMLMLEAFQSGLSWKTILHKRENFYKAFDGWDIDTVAAYDEVKYESLMNDAGIVRNKLKIRASIHNAGVIQRIRDETGKSFDHWVYNSELVPKNKPIILNASKICSGDPLLSGKSIESIAAAKRFKKLGFKFLGPTTIYSFMEAVGLVVDHVNTCFKSPHYKA